MKNFRSRELSSTIASLASSFRISGFIFKSNRKTRLNRSAFVLERGELQVHFTYPITGLFNTVNRFLPTHYPRLEFEWKRGSYHVAQVLGVSESHWIWFFMAVSAHWTNTGSSSAPTDGVQSIQTFPFCRPIVRTAPSFTDLSIPCRYLESSGLSFDSMIWK